MKILFLGIDALDRLLLDEFYDQLPNFAALRKEALMLQVRSTFPPDSDTAWATIMTGLNPAQHGIVRFIDPLEKSYQILNQGIDNRVLHGKTFWEIIGRAGYQTAAIFPHLGYPIWPTPGVMVARGSTAVDVQANPAEILEDYSNNDVLLGVRGFPERSLSGMQAYFDKLSALAIADAEFALRLIRARDWDLFFVYWSTIDAISHFFWNYFDRQDPNFIEDHPLQHVILNTYQLYDRIVGQFLAAVSSDTTVIIMSDHGHGARPFRLVSVNEVLRQAGYLKARDLRTNPHVNLFEKSKRLAVSTISRYGLGKSAGRVMRNFPQLVQAFTRPSSVNWEKTLAYASDMSGIKSYTYGGVIINQSALNGRDYEKMRGEIMELLQEACTLPDGTPLVDFIARREDLYTGRHIANYPDIVLEFKYGYGLGWAIDVPLMTQADAYNLVPGSHRGDTGVFLMQGPHELRDEVVDLRDITPSILDLAGVMRPRVYEGRSILKGTHP